MHVYIHIYTHAGRKSQIHMLYDFIRMHIYIYIYIHTHMQVESLRFICDMTIYACIHMYTYLHTCRSKVSNAKTTPSTNTLRSTRNSAWPYKLSSPKHNTPPHTHHTHLNLARPLPTHHALLPPPPHRAPGRNSQKSALHSCNIVNPVANGYMRIFSSIPLVLVFFPSLSKTHMSFVCVSSTQNTKHKTQNTKHKTSMSVVCV